MAKVPCRRSGPRRFQPRSIVTTLQSRGDSEGFLCGRKSEGLRPGGRKRRYPAHFVSKLTDADAEATETMIWLDFSLHCAYINTAIYNQFSSEYEQIGKMLGAMISEPEKFCYKTKKPR